jgi:DNA-binding MarR family transcriptional regulator
MATLRRAQKKAAVVSTTDPRRVEIALFRASRSVRRAFNTRLAAIDLNMTQAGLLSCLDEHGSLTQRELADLLHITRVSAGTCIDSLEARSLVKRTGDPDDRRVWLISLTREAGSVIDEFKRIDDELRSDLRRGFERAERQQLAALLDRLTIAADDAVDGDGAFEQDDPG